MHHRCTVYFLWLFLLVLIIFFSVLLILQDIGWKAHLKNTDFLSSGTLNLN